MWLWLFKSCTGCQSLRGSNTNCACWFTSCLWDTCWIISRTFWHRLPIFRVDLHYAPHHVATSTCRGRVDELATEEPFLLLHREHGRGCRHHWNCCDRQTRFVVIWKNFYLILSTAPGYGLTLSCALGLLVRGAIQVPQLQLQLQCGASCQLLTVSIRAFSATAPQICSSLSDSNVSAVSMSFFQQLLNTILFQQSFSDILCSN